MKEINLQFILIFIMLKNVKFILRQYKWHIYHLYIDNRYFINLYFKMYFMFSLEPKYDLE